jgi:hypothetical protein
MTEGTPLSGDVSGMMPPSVGGVTSSRRAPRAPALLGEPEPGKGGGGGGSNAMTARIEALVASLQTEREIIADWYAESLLTLQTASEAELEALGGKHKAEERLEEEHQKRLNEIRQMSADSSLSLVMGAGAEILNAMGQTNKKALKVAKVFGAAQALISTYQGAAEALKLPFPKNMAAAAAVIAKGIGFVNAIRGTGESGGGGSRGGGSSGSSAAAPAQQNAQTLNFSLVNDPFGFGANFARQIATQLNEAQRNGNTLIRATVT